MKYRTTVSIEAYYDTDKDPDDIINELLDRLGTVNTDDLNLTWDDCEWEHYVQVDDNMFIQRSYK